MTCNCELGLHPVRSIAVYNSDLTKGIIAHRIIITMNFCSVDFWLDEFTRSYSDRSKRHDPKRITFCSMYEDVDYSPSGEYVNNRYHGNLKYNRYTILTRKCGMNFINNEHKCEHCNTYRQYYLPNN
jgi:hypothetical protein